VGRPLLVLDVLPGHGRDNLQHELELGNAYVTSANHDDVVANALAALAAGSEPAPAHTAHDWEAAFSSVLADLDLAAPVPGPARPG